MSVLIKVIETALPVMLTLLIGMFCREKQFLSREGVDALKRVVINITLPAVLVNAFATAQYTLSSLIIPVTVFCRKTLTLPMPAFKRALHSLVLREMPSGKPVPNPLPVI